MANPIEPTVVSKKDYESLLRDLEEPKPSRIAKRMYEAGKLIHEKLHRQ